MTKEGGVVFGGRLFCPGKQRACKGQGSEVLAAQVAAVREDKVQEMDVDPVRRIRKGSGYHPAHIGLNKEGQKPVRVTEHLVHAGFEGPFLNALVPNTRIVLLHCGEGVAVSVVQDKTTGRREENPGLFVFGKPDNPAQTLYGDMP